MTTDSTRFLARPHTRLGWWAVWLMAAFAVMWIINSFVFIALPAFSDAAWRQTILPVYAIFMLLCGLAAGIVGAIAITRQRERSWLVWLTLVPGLFVLFFLLGEFLVPH